MALRFTTSYLEDSLSLFRYYKKLGDGAMQQVSDHGLRSSIGPDMNSIAVIVHHLVGNMNSRWTDFLSSDGEKAFRDRDAEFEDPGLDRPQLLEAWEQGWACVFSALEPLTEEAMHQTITIRGEKHSVMQAINRQLAHYAYHVGQMVLLAKYLAGDQWNTLSIPRGQSKQFAARVARGELSQR
jgi:Protein of unknown function (DUF1572)